MPLTYDEQLKIPNRHYYENGVLKYGEPWTGDVWKVIYYLLQYHNEDIIFDYFYHHRYRGVAYMQVINYFQISEDAKDEINEYSYWKHFSNYIYLLNLYKL